MPHLSVAEMDFGTYTMSVYDCEKVLKNQNIKKVLCYFMPTNLIKRLKSQKITVELNYIDSINDIFMITNDAFDYDTLYYKRTITIKYNGFFMKDFEEFLNINKYLKYVHFYYYNKTLINRIVELLLKYNKTKVVLILHQSNKNKFIETNFEFLKQLSQSYKEYLNGEIRIIYTDNYLKNNLFKQLSYNNLKMSIVIILYVALTAILFSQVYAYISEYNESMLNYSLYSTINNESSISETSSEISVEIMSSSKVEEKDKYQLEKIYSQLKKINKEVIGWITVNNTKINYPVVQHNDNEYYLNHDFYKKKSSNGWIFLDYRNEASQNNDNIIIYGHDLKSGSQFGTLENALQKSWYKNKDNLTITFDSTDYNMKWEIFSIYTTNYTTDYLDVNFDSKDEYTDFINMIVKRSIYDFKSTPKYKTKILTLSTCYGSSYKNKRLVVHAKLISREES